MWISIFSGSLLSTTLLFLLLFSAWLSCPAALISYWLLLFLDFATFRCCYDHRISTSFRIDIEIFHLGEGLQRLAQIVLHAKRLFLSLKKTMLATRPHRCCNRVHWGSILRLWSRAHAETVGISFRGSSFLLSLFLCVDIRVWTARLLLCVNVLFWYIKCEKSWFLRKELLTFSNHAKSRTRLDKLSLMIKFIHSFLVVERGVPWLWVTDYISDLRIGARVPWLLRSVGLGNLSGHLAWSMIVHIVTYVGHSCGQVQLVNLSRQRLLSPCVLAFSATVVLVVALSCDNAFEVDIYTWTFLLLDIITIGT